LKTNLSEVSAYRSFVKARDLALEDFLHKATLEISDVLRGTLSNAVASIDMTYNKIIRHKYHPANIAEALGHIEQNLKILFSASGHEINRITDNLRKHSYALSYAGEAEAISRALAKPQDSRLGPDKLKHKSISKMPSGSDPKSRIDMELKSLERKMLDVVHRCAVSENSIEDFHTALAKVLPKRKRIEQKRKSLYKPTMREADQRPKIPVVANEFIDEETWQVLLDEYKTDFVPKWRGPEYVLEQAGPKPTKDDYYAWQFERELTQDFVEQVRLGQIDAARENGINDFVWIAIVDKATDDCCLWRDGLTTKEIELELQTKRRDDECESSVPPAHFDCRCTLAPALEGIPDKPETDIGSFEEWLSS